MRPSEPFVPEVFERLVDRHDAQQFLDTVLDFAEAGGAFVYPVSTDSTALIVSPRAIDVPERLDIYKKHHIEEVRDLLEGEYSPEDILGGFLVFNEGRCERFHYALTPEEVWNIAKELEHPIVPDSVAMNQQPDE